MKRETVVTAKRHVSECFMFVIQNVLDNVKTATVNYTATQIKTRSSCNSPYSAPVSIAFNTI